ncbi:eif-2Bdelta [Pristionchus pacificus]|uniref:Translation initiation factor eIF2B subunit delta n=1 Tax=Pristionchus pacificus TaxID=54126 RepID=A0A2A6CRR6_PRIPA|nr:eif-2Bdelta [Pristionchus pacificus]|eukprot:PDM80902.1 hypothetical protein PRIPAC_35905 [Pristionchus pacificus]
MGKNKGKSQGGSPSANTGNQQSPKSSEKPKQSEPVAAPAAVPDAPAAANVEQITEQVNNLHLQNGEEANRDDVMAARKAKAAAKAEKAAKAAAKKEADAAAAAAKAGGEASTAAEPKQNNEENKDAERGGPPQSEMSKEEILAARKAKAVQQRAEKAAKAEGKHKQDQTQQLGQKEDLQSKSNLKQASSSPNGNEKGVRFVAHDQKETRDSIHNAFKPLFDRCESGDCEGPDELCLHFMECARQFISQFTWDNEEQLGTMMDDSLSMTLKAITQTDRYPLPYAMGNVVRQLRKEIMQVGRNAMTKRHLLEWLDDSEQQYFSLANSAISQHLQGKIAAATKIITYDWCPVVNHVLIDSKTKGSLKKLTVLDAAKNGPGVRHLTSLADHMGYVEYGDLTAVGSIFERGSLVLLGCSAVLSSGRVCLPKGAFQLSLVARAANVPVLILAPTYKFVDRAQAASRFALLGKTPLDILPPDLITAIVTDIRLLPPSSAPAVLKAKALDDAN